jgi:hypothetical protein
MALFVTAQVIGVGTLTRRGYAQYGRMSRPIAPQRDFVISTLQRYVSILHVAMHTYAEVSELIKQYIPHALPAFVHPLIAAYIHPAPSADKGIL